MLTDADSEEGTWVDTYALHFPPKPPRKERFERGVGTEGYDRRAGVDVPKHPRLRRPGEQAPVADPFDEGT